jgi:hypothetical protein
VLSDEELDDRRLGLSHRYFERRSDQRLHEHFAQALRESGRVSVADETPRRPRLIIATGESGAGKTCALLRLIRAFPELAWSEDGRIRPHLRLSVKAPATLKSVGLNLLSVVGYPMASETKEHVVWDRVHVHLAKARTRALVLDEFHHCVSRANVEDAERIRDTIKSLLTSDDPLIVVLAGLPEINDFVRMDTQVLRRGRTTGFETVHVDDADVITQAVAELAKQVDVSMPEAFEEEIVPRLLHAARGQLGLAIEMSVDAIVNALAPVGTDEKGREVRLPPRGHLLLEDYARMYEDRTDNMPFANIFVAEDWLSIDPTLVNVHLPSQLRPTGGEAKKAPVKPRRRSRR